MSISRLAPFPCYDVLGFTCIQIGTLNGLFVLGRSIGFIGHHLDQKRLRAPLYRHPADDIFINMADLSQPRVLGKVV